MKQCLYIVTGLPFAGKSTLIKELVKKFRFNIASVDEMMNKKNLNAPEMTQEDWNLVYSQAYKKLERLSKRGKTVVFDGGSLLKSERDTLKKIAQRYDVFWKLIYVNTSKEEIIERRKRSLITKNRDPLADETMDKAFEMFEEPTPDENVIIYNPTLHLKEWIKNNIY